MSDDDNEAERVRAREKMTSAMSLALIAMIERKFSDFDPDLVVHALAEAMATMIVMFANSEASVRQGADRGADALRHYAQSIYELRRVHVIKRLH